MSRYWNGYQWVEFGDDYVEGGSFSVGRVVADIDESKADPETGVIGAQVLDEKARPVVFRVAPGERVTFATPDEEARSRPIASPDIERAFREDIDPEAFADVAKKLDDEGSAGTCEGCRRYSTTLRVVESGDLLCGACRRG